MDEEALMREALKEAKQALSEGETPVGAVIVREGQIIAHGHNMREQSGDPTAHAEIVAIREAARRLGGWRLSGCALYVTLEPCPMCAGAIVQSRIERVRYGARDPRSGCCGSVYRVTEDPAFNHFAPADGGLLEGDCQALLDQFFQKNR